MRTQFEHFIDNVVGIGTAPVRSLIEASTPIGHHHVPIFAIVAVIGFVVAIAYAAASEQHVKIPEYPETKFNQP